MKKRRKTEEEKKKNRLQGDVIDTSDKHADLEVHDIRDTDFVKTQSGDAHGRVFATSKRQSLRD